MIFLMVLLTVVIFAIVDFTLRKTLQKMQDGARAPGAAAGSGHRAQARVRRRGEAA